MTKNRTWGAALLASVAIAAPAHALTINLIDDGTVAGSQAAQGFAIAAAYWESVLTNNVTVNFEIGYDNLGSGILGGTSSNMTAVSMQSYESKLAATGTSPLDGVVASNLPALSASKSVSAIVPAYSNASTHTGVANSGTRVAPDGQAITSTVALSTANYKALYGDSGGSSGGFDAYIQFSSNYSFDFNPTNGISSNAYDFIGVAVHEMGHALGMLSGVDDFDYATPKSPAGGFQGGLTDSQTWADAADLFRYTGKNQLNWAPGQPAYFSIDGGATAFDNVRWSTGEYNGDGYQASHWKAPTNSAGAFICSSSYLGIWNPYTCAGQSDTVTANDIALLDAIGWNTNVDALHNTSYAFTTAQMVAEYMNAAAVPEPTIWATMIVGFGAIGAMARRRRPVAATA